MDHDDFTGAGRFAVHTRWIETDFADQITLAPRNALSADPGVLRTFVEIDGKRHELGLPAELLRGLSLNAPATAGESTPPSEEADPQALRTSIGRAHVRTPVTNAHIVCRLLLKNTKN